MAIPTFRSHISDTSPQVIARDTRQALQSIYSSFKANPYVGWNIFDANTILKADSDNTPLALTVAEQTIVGRITSGNIDALTDDEVHSIIFGTTNQIAQGIALGPSQVLRFYDSGGTNYVAFQSAASVSFPITFTLMDGDGATDTALGTNGAGTLTWRTHDQISGRTHDGDTLQLDGVNSDGGAFSFTTSGQVTFSQDVKAANFFTGNQGEARFYDSDSSNYVGFEAPATVSSNQIWILPDADATTSGQPIVSDASGNLSWGPSSAAGHGAGGLAMIFSFFHSGAA